MEKGALSKMQVLKDSNTTEGGTNALQEQFPGLYGFLAGAMGTAPDEIQRGSVLDPRAVARDAAVRSGANVGFPIGTAAQIIPALAPALKWAGAGEKANEAMQAYLQATGLQRNIAPLGKKAVSKAAVDGLQIPGFTPEQIGSAVQRDNFVSNFGGKAEREAALAKRVQQQAVDSAEQDAADATATGTPGVSPESGRAPRARYTGGALPADYLRQLEIAKGPQAVQKAVQSGVHTRPDGNGGYVGYARTVDSPQALGALRRSIDSQFNLGVDAVEYADPTRLGTWYDRAKDGIANSTEPHQLDRVLDQHAAYSAGVAPEAELGFALKHLNSRAIGLPVQAYRGPAMRSLDNAVANGVDTPLAFKTGEYRNKNDPRLPNVGQFGVNDFRWAGVMHHTNPDGSMMRSVSDPMHLAMDGETAMAVNRANEAGIGGRTDWQGPHLQEVPWVYAKAQDIYTRGSNGTGRYAGGDVADGMAQAVRDANNTAQDYMYKHAGSATYESVPGASTGHVPSILDASAEDRAAYSAIGPWAVDAPYTLPGAPSVGAGKRDALYSAVGYRQLPSLDSAGAYTNSRGVVEHNPMTIARPLLDFPTGGTGHVADGTKDVLSATERFRATMDAQEYGAYNLPNSMDGAKGKNGLVLDSRGRGDSMTGAQPTAQQLTDVGGILNDAGFGSRLGVSATSRGMHIFPYAGSDGATSTAMRELKKQYPALQAAFPSEIAPVLSNTGYVPGIVGAPYSGESTAGVLDAFAKLKPGVAQNVSESEAVRNAIREKTARDAALPGPREDIQNMRRFFSDADWSKAVDLIRKGATPAAALGAMGYSLNSMAAPAQEAAANAPAAYPGLPTTEIP